MRKKYFQGIQKYIFYDVALIASSVKSIQKTIIWFQHHFLSTIFLLQIIFFFFLLSWNNFFYRKFCKIIPLLPLVIKNLHVSPHNFIKFNPSFHTCIHKYTIALVNYNNFCSRILIDVHSNISCMTSFIN